MIEAEILKHTFYLKPKSTKYDILPIAFIDIKAAKFLRSLNVKIISSTLPKILQLSHAQIF